MKTKIYNQDLNFSFFNLKPFLFSFLFSNDIVRSGTSLHYVLKFKFCKWWTVKSLIWIRVLSLENWLPKFICLGIFIYSVLNLHYCPLNVIEVLIWPQSVRNRNVFQQNTLPVSRCWKSQCSVHMNDFGSNFH